MPHLHIDTNLPRSKIPADFAAKVIPVVAKTLDRSPNLTMVSVTPDVVMSFGGTPEPCASGSIVAIERFSPENNKKFAKIFFDLIQETLGIPADRVFLNFEDVKKEEFGYNGVTLDEILK